MLQLQYPWNWLLPKLRQRCDFSTEARVLGRIRIIWKRQFCSILVEIEKFFLDLRNLPHENRTLKRILKNLYWSTNVSKCYFNNYKLKSSTWCVASLIDVAGNPKTFMQAGPRERNSSPDLILPLLEAIASLAPTSLLSHSAIHSDFHLNHL